VQLLDKAIAFRNAHKFSGPTVFIGIAFLLFPLWGAFSGFPSITAIFGYGFIFVACAYSLYYFREQLKIGSLWFFVPLLVLFFLALSRFAVGSEAIGDKILLSAYFLMMIGLYFTAKQKGETLLWFAIPAIIVYSIDVIVDGLFVHYGIRARGISTNCNTVAAMLMFCIFMLRGRWIWLVSLALVAIALTGSYWALSGLAVGGIAYLVAKRRELKWSNRITKLVIVCAILMCLMVGVGFSIGLGQKLFGFNRISAAGQNIMSSGNVLENLDSLTYGRFTFYKYAFVDKFSWLGNGLNNVENTAEVPGIGHMLIHNIPSMVMFELGPLALLVWLITIGYGIYISSKYRYVLVAVLCLSVFGGSEFYQWYTYGSYYFLTLGLVGNEICKGRDGLKVTVRGKRL
jgi:hypothetical protein